MCGRPCARRPDGACGVLSLIPIALGSSDGRARRNRPCMCVLVGRVVVAYWLPWRWRLLGFACCDEVYDADDASDGGLHLLSACFRDGKAVISAFFQRFCPVVGRFYPYSWSGQRDRAERCNSLTFVGVPACRGSRLRTASARDCFWGASDSFSPVQPFAERRATMEWGMARCLQRAWAEEIVPFP
jgi:hypothetical protein